MTRRLSKSQLVSTLAIATGMIASQTNAAGKGFLANGITAFGDVGISTSTDTTDIFVNSVTAVIDWTPDDNATGTGTAINFLDSTGTANFQGFSDFAVLNRINVADNGRQILLNGAINSSIGQATGGHIFFYSPSGFVVGSSAVINVGSLVLSASPIAVDGNGGFINGGTVTFNQAPNSLASIVTATGSQINAFGSGSYVALVAPSITHSGSIKTDTAAALVAAEAATITFSPDGLFNIQVTTGTDAATGIDVDGGTIGRNSAVEGVGNHHAYLVGVAKNDAVAMLIRNGGSVGFDTATSAAVEDNVVVLSGGYSVNGTPNIPSGTSTVDLTIDNATFSSDTIAVVSGGATITTSTGSTGFGNNLSLLAGADSFIQAINGNTLSIGGSLSANLDKSGFDIIGNFLRLAAYGGSTLTVGGDVTLSANAYGTSSEGPTSGNSTGGTVIVQTGSNSSIGIGGVLDMSADGFGGESFSFGGAAGNGTGGIAQIEANGGTSSIDIGGATLVSAQGVGGSTGECTSCSITGGIGSGGQILVEARVGSGNILSFGGTLDLDATGFGGAGDTAAGAAFGGSAQINAGDGGSITVAGNLDSDVSAEGGYGFNTAAGGAATGGNSSISFSGAASTIDLNGTSLFSADATGGSGVNGGTAAGGWVNLQAGAAGTLTTGFLGGSADAFGGGGDVGGTALGGRAWVQAIAGGAIVTDALSLSASGFAGTSNTGTGGYVIASADNGSLTVNATLDLEADGRGGLAAAPATVGGTGTGGQADIFADNGATVTLTGTVAADANGRGGNYFSDSSQGGNGNGGKIFFQASNGATLAATTDVTLTAEGSGGFSFGDCTLCGGTGGDGTGGTITVQAFGTPGAAISVGGRLSLSTDGFGSSGFAGAGGNGLGGTSRIFIADGGTLDVTSDLIVTAVGQGGVQDNGGAAGNGTGGMVDVATATGANIIDVGGTVTANASGFGGNASGTGSSGGAGLGGFARILAQGGLSSFASDVTISANGRGGSGLDGTGGAGTSGRARLTADGGDIMIGADLTIESISAGGDGNVGGDAITFLGADPKNTATSDARIVASNGDITISGATLLDVSAIGGNGANGGDGGDASAAFAAIHGRNSNLGPSTVTLGSVTINADGNGGAGGAGISGNAGSDGGNGGSGTGGFVVVTASAGNGQIDAGDIVASASGFGGDGASGGNGDSLSGGNGGDGGAAEGGFLNIGSESGIEEATGANTASANFASITALATAVGGDGGGFSFGTPNGLAGNGGAAQGGISVLLVRGSPVKVGTVVLDASATGGDGGFDANDAVAGNGGNATSGQVGVLVTNRLNFPLQRGSLNAGNIIGFADAFGGNGFLSGLSGSSGGLLFSVLNSDATIASVNLSSSADFFDPASPIAGPSPIEVRNGSVTIAGGFNFVTPGAVSMWADNGTLNAAAINVQGDNFIHDAILPVQVTPGTYSAGSITLTTGQDLIVDAHLSTPSSIALTAPGLVEVMNVTSGGTVTGDAGTDFTAANIDAFDGIDVLALGNITLGNLDAGVSINVGTDNAIELDAGGSILMGDATALGAIDFTAVGSVTGGNLTSGLMIGGDANGTISFGNLSAGLISPQGPTSDGFSIGIASATSISVGDAAGAEAVGFASLGTLDTGNINAGTDVLALVSGDMSFGSITAGAAGRTYLADSSMFIAAGGVDNFDASLVFGANPVATIGSISIGGPVSTGSFQAAAGTDFNAANITATNGIEIIAAGNIVLANLLAGNATFAFNPNAVSLDAGGSILMGNATALGIIDFDAGTTMTGGNLTSGVKIGGDANGAIMLGNLSGGLVNSQGPSDDGFSVGIGSGTSIAVGDAAGAEAVGFFTAGALTTGNINAGTDFLALASGNMNFGSITVGATGRVYLADASMVAAAGGPDSFDPALVYAAAPVATLGSITIGGPVSTGSFQAAAGTVFGSGSITAGSSIFISSVTGTTTGNLGAGTSVDLSSSNGGITTGTIGAGDFIMLDALTGIATGAMTAGSFIDARSGGAILTGDLQSTDSDIFLLADGDIVTGTVDAATDAEYDALGNVTLGDANVGGYLFVDAGGNLAMADAVAGESIDLVAGGTLLGANLTAGDSVIARSNGALILGNLSAGIVNPSSEPLDGQIVGIGSNTSVVVGNVEALNFIGLASAGALNSGALQSGGDVIALADGATTIASINNPGGRAYVAGFDMLAVGGGFDNFDPALVYAAANPIPTAGSVTISGSTTTGRLDAFVGGNFTAGPVTADAINARVGGLASLTGLWQAPIVDLWSNDIDIAATGGIDAGNSGRITLVSTNATQALIGDGLTGTGYQLSNAEFGRLSSGSLIIAARGDASAAIDMLIGDLSITGPLAGSTIDDPNGSLIFFTGNPAQETPGGVIRVTGNVAATGFEDNNVLEFVTGQFELDADTGSILVERSAGVLGGIIDITADRIHVASGAVLQRLTDDPFYDGREDDLAAPIATARPDGVIAADTIYVSPTEAVLVQNTGTDQLRAGFRAGYAELFPPEGAAPGSIELIVNGQLVTPDGILTGIDARDALVDVLDIAVYTPNSSINGCPLTGGCGDSLPPLFPPGFTPTPGIQQEITLINRNLLPPPYFGNEDFIDDNDEDTDEGETSPIIPPRPLFDTSALYGTAGGTDAIDGTPMRSDSGLDQKGDVDDPVSGSGNPALMDVPPTPPTGNQEKQP